MTPFFVHVETTISDSCVLGIVPERQLREIMTFAYEAALEAGLSSERAFFIIENWLKCEQLQQRNTVAFSGCAISSTV